jgi:hypothetical protein
VTQPDLLDPGHEKKMAINKNCTAEQGLSGIAQRNQSGMQVASRVKSQYAGRTANMVAHTLAQHAMHTKECVVESFKAPSCIRKLVCLEVPPRTDPELHGQQPPGVDPCTLNTA